MGLTIDREHFDEEDYRLFAQRLEQCLLALRELLARPDFGEGEASVGAELELALVDAEARPLPVNAKVVGESADPRLTVELDRFNLECNLPHMPLCGRPFTALGREIEEALVDVRRAARAHGGRIAMIGILPTLLPEDLQSSAMTDEPRYRALSAALRRIRREPFRVRIAGADPLDVVCEDVTFEGAATALQIHLRVAPRDFAPLFNSAQIATAPVLAVAGNSPTFLGHRLWEETRVALFKQAVDARSEGGKQSRRAARVSFGRSWVAEGALELFAEAIDLHEVLLPVLSGEDPLECLRAGRIPRLDEVRLHEGTVWRWNRPIYDPAEGGHLRIEMRALPAGPTTVDMLANAAFLIGLSLGLAPRAEAMTGVLPFERADDNFYRAAQHGLDAELHWPDESGAAIETLRAERLVPRLLGVALRGLAEAGVDREEADALLAVIEERCASRRTGAAWQRRVLAELDSRLDRKRALAGMLERYLDHSRGGEPVHRWPVES